MTSKKLILLTIVILMIIQNGFGQNFEWLRSFGTKNGQERISGVLAESNGNNIFISPCFRSINLPDTLNFDTIKFFFPPAAREINLSYIVRLDSNGKTLNAHKMGNFVANQLTSDNDGNFYVAGRLQDTGTLVIGNKSLNISGGNLVFAKYDKNFNLLWLTQSGSGGTSGVGNLKFSGGYLNFICDSRGTTTVGNKTYYLGSVNSSIYGELNPSDGKIIWSECLQNNGNSRGISLSSILNINHKLYLTGANFGNTTIINSDTVFAGGLIIITDSIGKYKKRFSLKRNSSIISFIASDGQFLYIGGYFTDSLRWGNKIIIPEYSPNSGMLELYAASLTIDLQPRWFFHPKVLDKTRHGGSIGQIACSGGFIYFGGRLQTKIMIGNNILNAAWFDGIVFKTDIFGNILWAVNGGTYNSQIESMDAVAEKSVFIGGVYADSLKFGIHKVKSNGIPKYQDAFITKISDNAIIRGPVVSGPYCLGDTIFIPYKKIGDFDTANIFIAELSDEKGEFNGSHYELGRLKSNKNGNITGKLPLFQVASSKLYRIRILSTHPAVQSYYKFDTLRLLIYSRDKADPGKDTTICKGDSVTLRTYGGTKWTWSPKYRMQDSTARETPAWPDKTTRYKIIIADSSGCGEADTAFKTIYVRKEPSIKMMTPDDTSVCIGGTMPIIVSFLGGDSVGYAWDWFAISPAGSYTFIRSGSGKQFDTLMYKMSSNEKDSQQFIIYLNDGCTPKIAFRFFTLKVSKQKAISTFSNKDTTACPGKSLPVIVKFSQGHAAGYNWQWYEKNITGQWIPRAQKSAKLADTLNYILAPSWKGPKQMRVILKDNCSEFSDTVVYTITPKDTLELKLNTYDTLLCKGQFYVWHAKAKGGYVPGYNYTWTDQATGDTLSIEDSLRITANAGLSVFVNLNDGCMPKPASNRFKITVNPELSVSITDKNRQPDDTTICYGQAMHLTSSATGGWGNNYSYAWYLDNKPVSNKDSIHLNPGFYVPDTGGIIKLSLVLRDNCTLLPDTALLTIRTLPKLKLVSNVNDSICYKEKAVFHAKGSGGKPPYQYKWHDQNHLVQGNVDSLELDYILPIQEGLVRRYTLLNDGCSAPSDTAWAESVFCSPLILKLSTLDTCPPLNTLLNALPAGGKSKNYSITWWQENTLLGSGSALSRIVTPPGKPAWYKAVLDDACSPASDTARIHIGLKPDVKIIIDSLSGCEPLTVTFGINTTYLGAYTWDLMTGKGYDSLKEITANFVNYVYPSGAYLPRIRIRTEAGCQNMAVGTIITIHPKPIADFDFIGEKPTLENPFVEIRNTSINASYYRWDIETLGSNTDKDPKLLFSDTGWYKVHLTATTDKGCKDSIEKQVYVSPDFHVWMPSAFSPNGDMVNDFYSVYGSSIKNITLIIYNRWGELIFSTDNQAGWDGTFMGEAVQEGVYFYRLSAQGLTGRKINLRGTFVLLR